MALAVTALMLYNLELELYSAIDLKIGFVVACDAYRDECVETTQ
jgi:hypothetical protein